MEAQFQQGQIFQGADAVRQPHTIAAMGRLRHEVFCNRLKWDVHSVQGIEFDQFDVPDAFYGAITDAEGRMEGCFRLLSTTGSYMLRDVFGQLLHGRRAPEGEDILEISRLAVLPAGWRHNAKSTLVMITARILKLLLSFCLERDIRLVTAVTDIRFEKLLKAAGLACERFGPPLPVGNTTAVAGWMVPSEESLARVSAVHDRMVRRNGDATATSATNSKLHKATTSYVQGISQ